MATMTERDHDRVLKHMRKHVGAHVDPRTGEVNYTGLAEGTATDLDLYEDTTTYTIPEWVYDMAVDVGTRHESKRGN